MTRKTLRKLALTTPRQRNILYHGIQYLRAIDKGKEEHLSFLSFMEKYVPYANIPSYVAHGYSPAEQALWLFNHVLLTYGVECIMLSSDDKRHRYNGDPENLIAASYLNTGDTYQPTLVYRFDLQKRWDVISWGDLVVILEKKGYCLA